MKAGTSHPGRGRAAQRHPADHRTCAGRCGRRPPCQGDMRRRQAADQAQQRRSAAIPETAVRRGQSPARGQRRHGDQQGQPDRHRVVRGLPDRGLQARVQRDGCPLVEIGLQVGVLRPEQADPLGHYPGTSASSTPPGATGCIREPGNRLLPAKVRLDTDRPYRTVAGTASPDDPTLTHYWAERRRRSKPPLGNATLRLLQAQHGRCPLCRGLLLLADQEPQHPSEWERWLKVTRKAVRKHAITATLVLVLQG